jgi:hypothetical protein
VHAVNYALRCPFFVSREQVIRLLALRLKRSQEVAESKKCEGGVPPSAFVDFCVVENKSLSLMLVRTLKVEDGQGSNTLKAFITEIMLESSEFTELIVVGLA